jgi:pyridoxamine 5'-phosphate oxidase
VSLDRPDPWRRFADWLRAAEQAGIGEPAAMTLATVSASGRPSARIVLLKELDDAGFVFSTNYDSRKGIELTGNAWGALVFYWQALQRQVRVEGQVEKTPPGVSDRIFAARPRGARLGAWASAQSTPIDDREVLERAHADAADRFPETVPRPEHWGAYLLRPERIEFWQGDPNRLHDRQLFSRADNGSWRMQRLAP